MKLILLFLFFISTAYAELEWKNSDGCPTTFLSVFGPIQNYTLSDDCQLYNPDTIDSNSNYNNVFINNIEVSIRGTRNTKSTTIDENTDLVTVTAISGNRHFYLNGENATLTLSYIKLVGGDVSSYSWPDYYGGSIYIGSNGGELNLYSSIVFNNKAYYGGGIYAYGASNTNKNAIMNIYNSIINDNVGTSGDAGGIYMHYANVTIYNTKIDNNSANLQYGNGGGMGIWDSDVTMQNTTISKNKAYKGGGLYINGDSTTVTLRQTSFIDNHANPNRGYEIATFNSPTISLINTYFNNPDNNNIYENKNGSPKWKTCETNNSPCDYGETCSEDSNLPNKAVRCEAVCVINIEITGTCTDDEKKRGLIDKYKNISGCG